MCSFYTLHGFNMSVSFKHTQNSGNESGTPPLNIMNRTVAAVETFGFLGTTGPKVRVPHTVDSTVKKAQQRLYSFTS